jgi:hypothetical protein
MNSNPRIAGFQFEDECLADIDHLRQNWNGRMPWLRRTQGLPKALRSSKRRTPTIAAFIITCPERDKSLRTTLCSLAASDWTELAPTVIVDPERTDDRHQRICQQVLRAMQQFLDKSAEYFLLLEDDLIFNRYLHHNVHAWEPFRRREISLAGLYNPGLHEIAYDIRGHAVAVAPESAFGTQALLISRPTVARFTAVWNTVKAPADLRMMQIFGQLRRPLYYHAPSLIQHRQEPSLSFGIAHSAPDFDPNWRA